MMVDLIGIFFQSNLSNQLKTESDGDETITFNYDYNGRVQEINSSTGSWRRYDIAYNELGAVTSEKQAISGLGADKTVAYDYDANGLLNAITYPDGRMASYGNNALLLPESLAFNNETNRISAVTYGVNKQPLGYILGNGALFAATYDFAGRVVTSGLSRGGSTLLAATYGYDNVGNIDSLTSTTPAGDASFQYDAFNRLTKATYLEKIYDYAYDPFGNMLVAQENSLTVFSKGYTEANRISGYSYDGRGNLTQGEGLTQVWDKRNRLTESRTATNTLLGTYIYNERGLRIKAERYGLRTVQVVSPNGGESFTLGTPQTISWSGPGLTGTLKLELLVSNEVTGTIAENLPPGQISYEWQAGKILNGWASPGVDFKVRVSSLESSSSAGASYYIYDSGGKLLAEYDGIGACVKDYLYLGGKMVGEFVPSSGSYYYYASDQINSTRLVTDSTGAVVHSAQYDPYGGLYKTWVDTYHPKPGFSGKEREFGSEMDYFGARYYGHKQYRFLSVDPIITKDNALINPQLWNLYVYCGNNPLTFFDPDGRELVKVKLNGIGNTFLDRSFYPLVLQFIENNKENGVTTNFTSAFRTYADQMNLQNDPNATTPAPPGKSLHEAGFAVDIKWSLIPRNKQESVVKNASDAGLSWGGQFSQIPDPVHFFKEVPGGKGNRASQIFHAQIQNIASQFSDQFRSISAALSTIQNIFK
jgi:RHS repeat-associated protein